MKWGSGLTGQGCLFDSSSTLTPWSSAATVLLMYLNGEAGVDALGALEGLGLDFIRKQTL
jgi:hypothetical protein